MPKMNITVEKNGVMKAKKAMKEDVLAIITAALKEAYGEDAVEMLRIVSPTTGKGVNTLGVVCADVEEDGGIFDGVVTIDITNKEWVERCGPKTTKPAFDFEAAKTEYEMWEAEETAKAAAKAEATAKKKAADEAARAKRKAEAAAKKAKAQASED